ncbi:MAG TPA: enolase C-terminal domain-like protein [Terriglobales bacterium]|nr:enolase C-terminal domain-like protein [Terriglobales bacterium]
MTSHRHPVIESVEVSSFTIPTDTPEADGTYEWGSTTLVVVEVRGGGHTGIGYTYADEAAATLIRGKLAEVVAGRSVLDVPAAWQAMVRSIRNLGRPGICSMAIAAVDSALWDLKAKLLGLPLVMLLGVAKESVAAYGSGGFTSYSSEQLRKQLGGWVAGGLRMVKMKIGAHPEQDVARVWEARQAIGDAQLFVDANGAYTRKQALHFADRFSEFGVAWFEEPVSSDDLEGLRLVRDRAPAGTAIAAGEYGYDLFYFRRMLEAGAVDVLQIDATRCAGITEFLRVAALAASHNLKISAHTAPTLHTHLCCAVADSVHVEYFHDHARIEQMLFEGAIRPLRGELRPDLSRPGLGIELKRADARRYAA